MRNLFALPRTPGQWLLSSLGWLAVCLAGWWGVHRLNEQPKNEYGLLEFSSVCITYFLIWLVVLPGSGAMLHATKGASPPALWWAAYWCRLLLLLVQVAVLLLVTGLLCAVLLTPDFKDTHF